MSLFDVLIALSHWLDAHAFDVFAASISVPLLGTIAAWMGKQGKTDTDGKAIASAFLGFVLFAVFVELILLSIAIFLEGRSVLETHILLLAAPLLCLFLSVAGIRMVFPLSQLGSMRMLTDVFLFVAALGALVWFLSQFRGWGLLFLGGIFQLMLLLAVGVTLIVWLGRRMFRSDNGR